jgi:hypothetical protein
METLLRLLPLFLPLYAKFLLNRRAAPGFFWRNLGLIFILKSELRLGREEKIHTQETTGMSSQSYPHLPNFSSILSFQDAPQW